MPERSKHWLMIRAKDSRCADVEARAYEYPRIIPEARRHWGPRARRLDRANEVRTQVVCCYDVPAMMTSASAVKASTRRASR